MARSTTALWVAVTAAAFSVSAMIGAPIAVGQVCASDEVKVAGVCTELQNVDNPPTLPPGAPGKIQCTQHSCVYREDS